MDDEPITFTPEETLEALQYLSPGAQMEISNVLLRRRLQQHMRELKQMKHAPEMKHVPEDRHGSHPAGA